MILHVMVLIDIQWVTRYLPNLSFNIAYILQILFDLDCMCGCVLYHIDGLVQERRNSSASAMELRLSCTNPSIYRYVIVFIHLLNQHYHSSYWYIFIWHQNLHIFVFISYCWPLCWWFIRIKTFACYFVCFTCKVIHACVWPLIGSVFLANKSLGQSVPWDLIIVLHSSCEGIFWGHLRQTLARSR